MDSSLIHRGAKLERSSLIMEYNYLSGGLTFLLSEYPMELTVKSYIFTDHLLNTRQSSECLDPGQVLQKFQSDQVSIYL